ncbi:hypothetical protein AQJ84_00660 [Streptomyces resistomycificus]|uniref:Secreted protein n=1 Tax=Streptomyces resistomycificus TaxID=67356 RepID=A0A0L8KXJ0_9ACTN|nr:hypothetical protein ADK37_34220 [Streptomyces resistomycificus]KUO02346.1 hypothetical protein AQJ84_00660 [Streptomyces resistomycificus]
MRGTTARAVLTVVAAVLFSLQFFAPTASFATAHTARHAVAKAQPGTKVSGKALRDESATFRHCDPSGGPTGPLHNRDRHRAVDFAPEGPERPLLAQDPAAVDRPVVHGAFGKSRPLTSHAPAALQVFRC